MISSAVGYSDDGDDGRRAATCRNLSGRDVENDEKSAERFLSDKITVGARQTRDRRVIDDRTFGRLKSKAVVVTAEDRRKTAEDLMADRERLERESLARKQKLQSYDALRTKGKRLAQVGRKGIKYL